MAIEGKGKQIAAQSSEKSGGSRRKKSVVSRGSGPGGRKRRSGVLQFFDDTAVDEDESSDDEDDEDLDWDVEEPDYGFLKDVKGETKSAKDGGNSHRVPSFIKEEMSDDELEELIKERYAPGSGYVVYKEEAEECKGNTSVMPDFDDTDIWRAKCMVGRERQMAFCFMQKFLDLHRLGTKLHIISVFALDHVKGYVFFEANKLSDIHEACRGFIGVYASRINRVPSTELSHLFANREKLAGVPVGTWVRMRSGNYKGDLAQVVHIDKNRNRATVKLIPRIDLNAIAKKFGGGVSLKLAPVPAPRLISTYELDSFRPHIEVRRDRETGELFEVLDGMMLKDGYLYKKVSLQSLSFSGVQPSNDELLKFSSPPKDGNDDLTWVSSVYNGRKKVRLTEPSEAGESSKGKNGYSLHDLVLFGKKDFGVIVAEEKDCYRILKGETEGAQVVSVRFQDVKSSFVDKMLSALDRHKKAISISSTVKVVEGPLEGREGIVRHMYKGTLFIHDENEQENGGLLSVKSVSCVTESGPNKSCSEHSGKGHYSSYAQTTTRSDDQQEFINAPHRRFDNDNNSFSVGQTLRIKAGPLKGYLCRVVSIRRSNITVKLDSLVKIITVEEKFLSDPIKKRENLTSLSSDLGNTETLFTGGMSWGEMGAQEDKNAWDAGPSGGNWQLPRDSNSGGQTGKDCDDDPWSSRAPKNANDSDQASDGWGAKLATAEVPGNDTWGANGASENTGSSKSLDGGGKASDKSHEADPWSSIAPKNANDSDQASDGWGAKRATAEVPGNDTWGANGASENTGSSKSLDGWGKASDKSHEADPWSSRAPKNANDSDQALDGWGAKLSASEVPGNDTWGANGASGNTGSSKSLDGCSKTSDKSLEADPWRAKPGAGATNGAVDGWGKGSGSVNIDKDLVGSSFQGLNCEKDDWNIKTTIRSGAVSDAWEKSAPPSGDQGGWGAKTDTNKGSTGSNQISGWTCTDIGGNEKTDLLKKKGKEIIEGEAWGRAEKIQDPMTNDIWSGATNASSQPSTWAVSNNTSGGDSDNWAKPKMNKEDGSSGWKAVAGDSGGWATDSTPEMVSKPSAWGSANSCSVGQADRWATPKVNKSNESGGWKATNSESCGWTDSKREAKDCAFNEQSSWGKPGQSQWGKDRGFGSSGDQDGNESFGRGRGRFGGRSYSDRGGRSSGGGFGSNDQDGNGSFGRGRFGARGRSYGDRGGRNCGSFGSNDDQDGNESSGRGWGRGLGRLNSYNRQNNQDNFTNETSNTAVSSWGNDGNTSWGSKSGNSWKQEQDDNGSKGNWGNSHGGNYKSSWGGNGDQDGNASGQGRGRGRGRFNSCGKQNEQDNFGGENYTSSWGGSGHDGNTSGRGRARGRGRFNSFDRQNERENCGGGMSKNETSSWGNDQNAGWGSKPGNSWNQEPAGHAGVKGSWGKDNSQDIKSTSDGGGSRAQNIIKPSGQGQASGWGSDQKTSWRNKLENNCSQQSAGDADKKDDTNERNNASGWGGGSFNQNQDVNDSWGKDNSQDIKSTSGWGGSGVQDSIKTSGQVSGWGSDQKTSWGNKAENNCNQQSAGVANVRNDTSGWGGGSFNKNKDVNDSRATQAPPKLKVDSQNSWDNSSVAPLDVNKTAGSSADGGWGNESTSSGKNQGQGGW